MRTRSTVSRIARAALPALLGGLPAAFISLSAFAQEAKPAAPYKLDLHNGGMTQGGDVPAYWNGKFGDVTLARDTTTFKNKPASFRVTIAGGKNGSGFQTVSGGANAKFKLTGYFKTAGNVKAQVMVQAFSDGYKQNQFIQVLYVQGDSEWTSFEKEIALPSWTAFFNIGIMAEGDGKAWLDEVHQVGQPIDAGSPDDALVTGPPSKDKPNVAGWGYYPQYPQAWQNMHKGLLERTKQGKVNIAFIGDSITLGWTDAGKEIWNKRYVPLGAVDYGIGGDSTRQVLWRIAHGEMDGISPKLIVLNIGTNNLYSDNNAGSDEEIAEGITAVVTTLRKKLPETKILLCGILPRQNDYFSNRIIHINSIIGKLDDGKTVRFLDMKDKFADSPAQIKANLYNPGDHLHLVTEGYQVWADAMQTLFISMLGKMAAMAPKSNGEHWIALPMVSAAQTAAGITPGGEGCQYPQTIAIDGLKGDFILFGTDVGGIYRSTNGGKTFSPCDMGYHAVGSAGFAIDPKNPDRCISIGDNTGGDYYEYDGVYLSTDRGASWKHVLPKLNRAGEKARDQVAFDPASYDVNIGYCSIAYWSEEGNGKEPGGRLYKSTDGGQTWAEIANGAAYGGGKVNTLLKIAPKSGAVYIANDSGFYKSVDGGVTFKRTLEASLTSLDVTPKQPNFVLVSTDTGLMKSEDGGETFAPIASAGMSNFFRLHVSPADASRIVGQNPKNGERFFSADGGKTWKQSGKDMAKSWIPAEILYNDRARLAVWHPTDPNAAWGIGPGDIITKTVDGGKTFQWANNGYNGIMTGGLFNFNAQNPHILYIGSQDYNGALTVNDGKTWEFINLSRRQQTRESAATMATRGGGFTAAMRQATKSCTAATAPTRKTIITCGSPTTAARQRSRRSRTLPGRKFPTATRLTRTFFSAGQPEARTGVKRGRKWRTATAFSPSLKAGKSELYGGKGKNLVRSRDKGLTWQTLATLPDDIRDIGYDAKHDRFYIPTNGNHLQECDGPDYKPVDISDRLPRDQHGDGMSVSTIAVDPVVPDVIYAGANGNGLYYQHSDGVARSTDGGKSWERLTCNPDYCVNGMTGGQMASAMRVHPVTRYPVRRDRLLRRLENRPARHRKTNGAIRPREIESRRMNSVFENAKPPGPFGGFAPDPYFSMGGL